MDVIRIRGARTHNLRDVDLDLPRDRLIVITGLSGSGKSSLAFDTIYAEGQRRYVESLSAYARQFLSVMDKPDVDHIEGLSPAIAIEQKATSHNPRSTVGTVTEIYDYLRVLYARAGVPRCPEHGQDLAAQTVSQMVDQVLALPEGTAVLLLAPDRAGPQGRARRVFDELQGPGLRARLRRRQGRRARRAAEPRSAPPAHHRRGRRPLPRAARRRAAARGVVRDGACAVAGRGADRVPGRAGSRAAGVLEPLRLHDLRLQPRRTRAAAVLVQQSGRRLRHLRRTRRPGVLRSGARRRQPGAVARGRRDPRLGSPQRLLFPADPVAREALPLRHRDAVGRPARGDPHVLLRGSDDERIEFRYFDSRGGSTRRSHTWEGILPNLERRYRETESPTVREELGKYLSTRTCPDCGGTRLNQAARNVFVGGHALPAGRRAADRRDAALFRRAAGGRLARRDRRADREGDRATACGSWSTSGSTT